MSSVTLNDQERAVLTAYRDLSDKDPDGAFAAYVMEVIKAVHPYGVPTAQATSRNLRKRKLLDGQGRGLHAAYWITDKGREALA